MPFLSNKLMKYEQQFLKLGKQIFHYTNWYHNKEFLSKQEIQKLLKQIEIDPIRAKVSVYGMPGVAQGAIYSHLMHKIKDKLDFEPVYFFFGVDYGEKRDSTALTLWATDRYQRKLACLECWTHNNQTQQYLDSFGLAFNITNRVKEWVKKWPKINNLGARLYYDSANLTFGQLIANNFINRNITNIKCLESVKIPILLRIDQWKTLMGMGNFYILDKASELYVELKNSIWDPNSKSQYKRLDKDDHCINSGEYATQEVCVNIEI